MKIEQSVPYCTLPGKAEGVGVKARVAVGYGMDAKAEEEYDALALEHAVATVE